MIISATAASKDSWLPISPEELAETSSPTNPDTPAEILYRRIESDQSGAPFDRYMHEYLRYKIYNPEKSDAYTRISRIDLSSMSSSSSTDRRVEILARLTLPDGTMKIFDKNDIKERPIQKTASDNSLLSRLFGSDRTVTEKFLAVTGVLPGSILEYQLIDDTSIDAAIPVYYLDFYKRYYPGETTAFPLQNPDLPVRKVEFLGRSPSDKVFPGRYFTLNRQIGNATSTSDTKKGTILITATNLPPSYREPLAGPSSYYSLTVLQCLSNSNSMQIARQNKRLNVTVNSKVDGPWAAVAAEAYITWEGSCEVTGKVKQLAQQLTLTAKTPEEKARLIHANVQKAYQEYRQKPKPKGELVTVKKMDDILMRDKEPNLRLVANDFLYLANALYLASGLETRGMLFPDRTRYPFMAQLVLKTLLPHWAVAIKLNGEWVYSMPQAERPIPFGSVPWFCERQQGLVIKAGPQELVDSPAGKSADARIINSADVKLAADGTLTGDAKRVYAGHHAYEIRSQVKNRKGKELTAFFQRLIGNDFKAVTQTTASDESGSGESESHEEIALVVKARPSVVIKNIAGLLDADGPVEVEYTLYLPGYAQLLAERMIFHPSVFRNTDKHPFTASERHTPIRLPFAWQEIDRLSLTYPDIYVVEKIDEPSLPSGPALHYKNKLTDDPATHTLTYRREYANELILIPPPAYSVFKNWNDEVLRCDQYQLVLAKKAAH